MRGALADLTPRTNNAVKGCAGALGGRFPEEGVQMAGGRWVARGALSVAVHQGNAD